MALTATKGPGDFKQPDPGTYPARCYGVIDLGTQHSEYQGKPIVRRQILIQWELPTETIEIDGEQKPLAVSKFYTLSLNEKSNLRPDLEAWRGRPFTAEEEAGFDVANVLGKACLVNVMVNAKGRAVVSSVMALPKGMTCPPPFNPTRFFSFEEYDHAVFMSLPDGLKAIIEKSDEYKELDGGRPSGKADNGDDDVPF